MLTACFTLAATVLPSVFATQTASTGGGAATTYSDSSVADVLPNLAVAPNSFFGHTYTYPVGTNGSCSSGVNTFAIAGYSTYQQFFTNDAGIAATVTVPFEITHGQVGTIMASTAIGMQTVGVEARIELTVNGGVPVTAFDFKADMTLVSNGAGSSTRTFGLTGPAIGGAPLPASASASAAGVLNGGYDWTAYNDVVSVVLNPGSQLSFLYTISSYATGTMLSAGLCFFPGGGNGGDAGNGGAVGGGVGTVGSGPGEPVPCNNYAIGRIGDPFNPDPVPEGIPEQASMTLLAAAFFGLAYYRRRRAD